MSSSLRSKGEIVITIASSGITSLLITGGRTAHSRFGIPLIINEDSTCNIKQGSPLVELIAKARLIIWDKAPMIHKHCFKTLDKMLRDVLRFTKPRSMDSNLVAKLLFLAVTLGKYYLLFLGQADKMLYWLL